MKNRVVHFLWSAIMPISGLSLEPYLAAFGGIGFLSFHPRPPRLSESDGGQAGRTKEQQKSC
jgi:hypothetical protein